jgi:hypothetical protein
MAIEDLDILKWREWKVSGRDDREVADEFATRAAEVRSQAAFLLSGGLTDGAVEALGALAEEDMVDFCIMVDLASGVDVAGVAPLDSQTRLHLGEFLEREPWRSLAVDNDITIALAMVEDVLANVDQSPWYRISPHLPVTLANLMGRVDREQYLRFAGELDARVKRHPAPSEEALAIVREIVRSGARRVGVQPP